jgi:hypothetical protein
LFASYIRINNSDIRLLLSLSINQSKDEVNITITTDDGVLCSTLSGYLKIIYKK